jgi:hypothetical protein
MFRVASFLLTAVLISACTSSPIYHQVLMKGQVVGFDGDLVVFCIGTDAGTTIGQEYDAYRYTYGEYYEDQEEIYDTVKVGAVVVQEIVNEHFAKGVVSQGEVGKHDVLWAK